MAATSIEWANYTFNPWIGCSKVSAGCANCYAERFGKRFGVAWGPAAERRRTSEANWRQPLAWDRKAARDGVRRRVFCASLADVFDAQVLDGWRCDLGRLIEATPHLDWLLLTKRIERWREACRDLFIRLHGDDEPLPRNVWLGASFEDQPTADARIPELLRVPAAVRFVSGEPLLGAVDLTNIAPETTLWTDALRGSGVRSDGAANLTIHSSDLGRLDWVIVGGESGPSARPMHPEWARSLQRQCVLAGVPFFFKQWGEFAPVIADEGGVMAIRDDRKATYPWGDDGPPMVRIGKRAAGRLLDGREWNEFPKGGAE